MDRIAIVGLGPLGLSIGLALKRAELTDAEVVGIDRARNLQSRASKMGAVDSATGNLRSALRGAGLVILDMPVLHMEEALQAVGEDVEKGTTVTDTGTSKVKVTEWAKRHLPETVGFVGGRPLPWKTLDLPEDAEATVFDDTSYCVVPSDSTDPDSVKTVVGLVEVLRAAPLFMDPHEHDSFAAAVSHLPRLLSAALLNATASSASWKEMSRLAGGEFHQLSGLAAGDPEETAAASQADSGSLDHWLGQVIDELASYRERLRGQDENLAEVLVSAWEHRARWEAGEVGAENRAEVPSAKAMMAGMFLGNRLVDRYSKFADTTKPPSWRYPGAS